MSNILADAKNIINGHEMLCRLGGNETTWPASYSESVSMLHSIDIESVHNSLEHKLKSDVWISFFYKTWFYYRKTYILDVDFFASLTKIKEVKIYPSILKTLPFNTFSVDLSGFDIFNGYILCSFDVTDGGIYCSFLANSYDRDDAKKYKPFGIFLSASDMEYDENNEPYFNLSKNTEEDADVTFFRKPKLVDSLKNIFTTKIVKQYKNSKEPFGPDFAKEEYADELEKQEEEYFVELKNINEESRWFLLKKALIQFAYYLCTPKPDVYETKETRHRIKRAQNIKKDAGCIEYKYTAGSRIGMRMRIGSSASDDIGETVEYAKGTPKRPHVRGAHWTHVWCGPKDCQHVEARFVEVTFVNINLGDIDEVCNEVSDKIRQNWEGENFICRTLDAIGLDYKRQSPIIVDGHRYKFDVGLKINGRLCYIEYDGEQHFYPIEYYGGQEGFEQTRKADLIKNNYCYKKNIPLLRIPYKEKGNIDKLVKDFVNDTNIGQFNKNMEEEYYLA